MSEQKQSADTQTYDDLWNLFVTKHLFHDRFIRSSTLPLNSGLDPPSPCASSRITMRIRAKGMTDSDIRAPDQVPLYFGQGHLWASLTPIPPTLSRHGGKLAGILQRAVVWFGDLPNLHIFCELSRRYLEDQIACVDIMVSFMLMDTLSAVFAGITLYNITILSIRGLVDILNWQVPWTISAAFFLVSLTDAGVKG
ncbi:uncharacterized protein STEHIDRAFT_158378 [Stereum hirsutum FP-91666 SS1]|uniref:uncharacterized protein n=1 Tax=Stereum hirsutum (strain FP-91666) TaxID=721885 RepID=UPI0004449FC3|nr:uncharacterized protein STEHIDRAFT_158378 [Stereum hirsutum FP-91666 SS1]EIM84662.1 hypothetical protein STEHIDRAFT_158378 [Stereum hirsutum FP-91666 SS1]